ncbi:MAG: thermonuclease family protein [Devosia sp.]
MRTATWHRSRRRRSPLGTVLTLVAIALIASLAAWLTPPGPALTGQAVAVDGDTIKVSGVRIRLLGFDAVELDQSCTRDSGETWECGRAARAFVAKAVEGGDVSCSREGRDRYGRVLARCRVGDTDLGTRIVAAGWAVADLEYALPLAEARIERAGIWSGSFTDPADWRRQKNDAEFDFLGWLLGLFNR